MKSYLLDTNVLLDYLTRRPPFGEDAVELMQAGADGAVRLYAVSLSFANIEYIVRRQTSATQARVLLLQLERLVGILAVDGDIIRRALGSHFTDFEDGIQYFTTLTQPAITAIITRDPKGFRDSDLPILSPAQAIAELDRSA